MLAGYGDPAPWTPQPTDWRTVLSFLALEKYPPALLYALKTLGPAIAALPGRWPDGAVRTFFVTFSRMPLFVLRAAPADSPGGRVPSRVLVH